MFLIYVVLYTRQAFYLENTRILLRLLGPLKFLKTFESLKFLWLINSATLLLRRIRNKGLLLSAI